MLLTNQSALWWNSRILIGPKTSPSISGNMLKGLRPYLRPAKSGLVEQTLTLARCSCQSLLFKVSSVVRQRYQRVFSFLCGGAYSGCSGCRICSGLPPHWHTGLLLSFSLCTAVMCYLGGEMGCAHLTALVRNQGETTNISECASLRCECCSALLRALLS